MTHNCKQPREDLLAYVETTEFGRDGVSAEECVEVAAHLEQCEVCTSEFEQIRASLQNIRETPSPEIPRNLGVLVSEAIRQRRARRSFFPVPALAYASLAVILLAATVFLWDRDAGEDVVVPARTAELSKLVEEQERWIIILAHTLEEADLANKENLNQASRYVLTRLDRSTRGLREGIEQGGLDPEMIPEYERTLNQHIDLLKEFYFQASSS